ncbi:MAG: phytoene desaturase family protein [candidate division KSB1 bacterium]|nr:phytoene desaturase family protein [candidate division KSB1 bacterium]
MKRIAVIGGGLAGLAGAISLAHRNLQVTLFEKNPLLGGKMSEIVFGGYRFDTGPSLLTMPFIIDDLFAACGLDRQEYLNFIPVAPLCRYFFPDGSRYDAYAEPALRAEETRRFSPSQVEAIERFLAYSRRIYELTAETFIFNPIHELRTLLNRRNLSTLLHFRELDAFRTVHQAVSRFFNDGRLVQLFDRYPTYNGSDPFKAPATLNIIPHVEYNLGGYYIQGGMYRLVDALHRIARDFGVEILLNTAGRKIEHRKGRIVGVQTDRGFIPVDAVLCNTDVVQAYNNLIDGFDGHRAKLNRLEPSISGIVFLWAVRGVHKEAAHHNIFFSQDYRREFQQIFDDLVPPEDPTVYAAITSKTDADHAPPNAENWFVLVNAPYLAGQNWHEAVEHLRSTVLQKLALHGFSLANKIQFEKVLTPVDFYERFGSNRGSIYGISSNSRYTAFLRPPNRSRQIRGLYFAGGSSHPGGGVPLVVQSGKIAAKLLIEDLTH